MENIFPSPFRLIHLQGAKAGRSIRLQINHSQPELKVSINNTDATTERTQLQKAEKTAGRPYMISSRMILL